MHRERSALRLEIIRHPAHVAAALRMTAQQAAAPTRAPAAQPALIPRVPRPAHSQRQSARVPEPRLLRPPHAANTVGATVRGGPLRARIANMAANSTNWAGASGTRLR